MGKNVFFKRKLKFKKYQVPMTGIFVDNGHSMQFNPTDSSKHILRGGSLMEKIDMSFYNSIFIGEVTIAMDQSTPLMVLDLQWKCIWSTSIPNIPTMLLQHMKIQMDLQS